VTAGKIAAINDSVVARESWPPFVLPPFDGDAIFTAPRGMQARKLRQ